MKRYPIHVFLIPLILLFGLMFLLSCYKGHGLSATEQQGTIRGRITYEGAWPDSTKEVRLVVLSAYPEDITDEAAIISFILQNLVIMSDPLPLSVDHYDYELSCPPGSHAWLVLAWFPKIDNYLYGVKELGAFYGSRSVQDGPQPVEVYANDITDHTDIHADLSEINNEFPFF